MAATVGDLVELLKMAATMALAATVVTAPNDPEHIALNMTAGEKESFQRTISDGFGDLEKKKQLFGM